MSRAHFIDAAFNYAIAFASLRQLVRMVTRDWGLGDAVAMAAVANDTAIAGPRMVWANPHWLVRSLINAGIIADYINNIDDTMSWVPLVNRFALVRLLVSAAVSALSVAITVALDLEENHVDGRSILSHVSPVPEFLVAALTRFNPLLVLVIVNNLKNSLRGETRVVSVNEVARSVAFTFKSIEHRLKILATPDSTRELLDIAKFIDSALAYSSADQARDRSRNLREILINTVLTHSSLRNLVLVPGSGFNHVRAAFAALESSEIVTGYDSDIYRGLVPRLYPHRVRGWPWFRLTEFPYPVWDFADTAVINARIAQIETRRQVFALVSSTARFSEVNLVLAAGRYTRRIPQELFRVLQGFLH